MLQHLRSGHRDIHAVAQDIPATPAKLQDQQKHILAQSSIIEGIENLKPMAPENRVAKKITDCIAGYCCLN